MKRLSQKDIIDRFTKEHGEFYDYAQVKYLHAKEKVKIICPIHGPFKMTPNNHLYGKQGCPKCAQVSRQINQQGPRINTRITQDEFISRCRNVHGPLYDYGQAQYITSHVKVDILCEKHGLFSQTPDQHINTGTGCPRCTYDNYIGGYSYQYFEDNPQIKNNKGWLYLVEMIDGNDKFYKIGITRRGIRSRFSGYSQQITPVFNYQMTIYSAFVVEQDILQLYQPYGYIPHCQFKGWTECFSFSNDMVNSVISSMLSGVVDYLSQ